MALSVDPQTSLGICFLFTHKSKIMLRVLEPSNVRFMKGPHMLCFWPCPCLGIPASGGGVFFKKMLTKLEGSRLSDANPNVMIACKRAARQCSVTNQGRGGPPLCRITRQCSVTNQSSGGPPLCRIICLRIIMHSKYDIMRNI